MCGINGLSIGWLVKNKRNEEEKNVGAGKQGCYMNSDNNEERKRKVQNK